jgi:hypothetical protein
VNIKNIKKGIIGTHVIPEYPSILTLLLFTASSIAAMLFKKREKQKFP